MRAMTMMHRLLVCVVCLLMLAPRFAPALGLGAIEVRSARNEPLEARIPLSRTQSGDVEGLRVALGSPAQFELAGIARLHSLELLEFTVVEEGGRGYIRVWTDEPIVEPSLTFLVEVDWPRGRTVRGYKLRLAQAVAGTAGASANGPPAPKTEREPGTGAPANGPPAPEVEREPGTGASVSTPAPVLASGGATYGPVRASDTLWSLATRLRPDDSVSVQRMMLALLEANPEAFAIRNVNALNAGAILRIPARDEIRPDGPEAAIAEVKRQHEAWARHRESGRAAPVPSAPAPVPSAPAPAPSSRKTEPQPSGRIEVVSPETAMNAAGREERADIQTLRNELALAIEEADVGRRENEELKLRLAEVEDHVRELSRLVALKSEEIAALQVELRAMAEMEPEPAPPETEPGLAPPEVKPEPAPASPEGGAKPEPSPAPPEGESKPEPSPAPPEGESKPEPAPPVVESKSMPFGLAALPVNPVFLVGGAGLLLILLGVVALLRRRASAGEDAALGPAEPPSPGEGNLLGELEAVAADLADETVDPRDRRSRAAPAAGSEGGMVSAAVGSDAVRSVPEDLAEKRIADLWKAPPETEHTPSAEPEADDGKADVSFDIDALAREDSGSSTADGEAGDDLDTGDLASEWKGDSTGPASEAAGDPDLHLSRHEARAADPAASAPASATGAGDPADLVYGIPDDRRKDTPLVTPAGEASVDARSPDAGTAKRGADWQSAAAADERADLEPGPDEDSGGSKVTPHALLDDPADHGEAGAFSMEDFGEGEVQTKLDLAQVYMEMGDIDRARGFIEAVLAEGDADQRDAAREMLSKLS